MKLNGFGRKAASVLAAASIAFAAAPNASAATLEESKPETPATNDKLPIIHTYRGSDHLKANILNPRPVCNSTEDYRTVVYKVTDNFLPIGTISTTNLSDETIPLSQDLSRSSSVTATINGDKTETLDLGGSGSKDGLQGNIGYSVAKSLGFSVSGTLEWSVGQSIGPYDVPAGNTGEATYGFRTVTMTGTQQRCRPNGTWATPTAWIANMPIKNEVRVKNYATPADSWAPDKGAQVTETENTEVEENLKQLNEGENLDDVTKVENDEAADVTNKDITDEGTEVIDSEDAAADSERAASEIDEVVEETDSEDAIEVDAVAEETEEVAEDTEAAESEATEDLDLEPYFTTSGAKAPGFAGSVALRVKNNGAKRYWAEFPALTFRVDVKTEDGPEGVDRLITAHGANGSYVRDLGYDFDKGVRSFEVTLSNPVNAGDDLYLGAFSFGDGDTKEGRIKNYMTVTQTARIDGDTSDHNDQDVDSREATLDDFGNEHKGIF